MPLSASKKGSDVFVKVLDVKTVEHWGKARKLSAIMLYETIRICLAAFWQCLSISILYIIA